MAYLIATFSNSKSPVREEVLETMISKNIEVNDIFEIEEVIGKITNIANQLRKEKSYGVLDVLVIKEDGTVILEGYIHDTFIGNTYPVY